MSKEARSSDDGRIENDQRVSNAYPPAVSAADVAEGNYARARFDDGLRFAIDELGRQRAPNEASEFRHKVGVAGELAVSGYYQRPINRTIYDGYNGDEGWDLRVPIGGQMRRLQIKTVCTGETVLTVDKEDVLTADYFVLCRTSGPGEVVEMIGVVNRRQLVERGYSFPGESTVRVHPHQMEIFEPIFVTPDRIREAQSLDL